MLRNRARSDRLLDATKREQRTGPVTGLVKGVAAPVARSGSPTSRRRYRVATVVPGLDSAADIAAVGVVDGVNGGSAPAQRLRDALQPSLDDETRDGEQTGPVPEF